MSTVELRIRSKAVAGSEDIIDVDLAHKTVEFVQVASTFSSNVGSIRSREIALCGLNLIVEGGVVERVPVAHVDEGRGGIELPVSYTIADSEALEVGLENLVVFTMGSVMLIDVVGHVGHVNSSIRFSREPEVVLLELRVLFIESQDHGQVILAGGFVIESTVFDSSAGGVSDSSRLVDPEHVHLFVPRLGVFVPCSFLVSRFDVEGTVFLSETKHGRASWTTIGPDHDWRVSRVSLSLSKHIVDIFGSTREVDVARV